MCTSPRPQQAAPSAPPTPHSTGFQGSAPINPTDRQGQGGSTHKTYIAFDALISSCAASKILKREVMPMKNKMPKLFIDAQKLICTLL